MNISIRSRRKAWRFFIGALILTMVAGNSVSSEEKKSWFSMPDDPTRGEQIAIRGACLRCLIAVANDMTHRHMPLNHYIFVVSDKPDRFEITTCEDDRRVKDGDVTYKVNKHSATIIQRD